MARSPQPGRLRRELALRDVYAIATGTTLSTGLFLLPGPAFAQAGPAAVLAYLIAALPMIPAMFSVVELSTAMPRAGGAYYFLDRSLGPMAGAVGGLGTWLALVLKTAFALIGMGAYLGLFFPEAPMLGIAVAMAVAFGALNLVGSRRTGSLQMLLVAAILSILAWFVLRGLPAVQGDRFAGFFEAGSGNLISTAGLVYISYVGVTNVASVSEEVSDPERNLPRGIFLALGSAVLVYVLCTAVMVGVVPREVLAGHLTPVAEAAFRLAGAPGQALVSLAAVLAFASVANAGILASSRYPLAMSRDRLLPDGLAMVNARGTPTAAVLLSVAAILALLLLLDPVRIAKLASAFQLTIFALLCLAVIVMRESGIESYDPGYRSPFYPWLQVAGLLAPLVLISGMGVLPALFTCAVVVAGVALYLGYGQSRVERHGAIYHVFERLGRRRYDGLDRELRGILKEKGPREADPFDQVIAHAEVLEGDADESFESLVGRAAASLAPRLRCSVDDFSEGILEGTRTGATPVAGGVALPHLRLVGLAGPVLALARSRAGLRIHTGDAFGERHTSAPTHAIFFLVSPEEDAGMHLRLLAHLASRVEEEHFLEEWMEAGDANGLREALLHHERYALLTLSLADATAELIDRELREVTLPEGCLVALIRREDRTVVPRGGSRLYRGDVLTVIGDPPAIRALEQRFPGALPGSLRRDPTNGGGSPGPAG